MFLSGLLFGSVIIFLLCYKERVLDTQLSIEASAGIGLGIGLLCGLVTMLVRSVGLFMTGILLGLLLAIAGLLLTHQLYTPSTLWVSTQCTSRNMPTHSIQYFQPRTHLKENSAASTPSTPWEWAHCASWNMQRIGDFSFKIHAKHLAIACLLYFAL